MYVWECILARLPEPPSLAWPSFLCGAKVEDKPCEEEPLIEDAGVEVHSTFKITSTNYHGWILSVEESKVWKDPDLDAKSTDLSFWEHYPSNYGCKTNMPVYENVITEIDESDAEEQTCEWMIYIEELLEY